MATTLGATHKRKGSSSFSHPDGLLLNDLLAADDATRPVEISPNKRYLRYSALLGRGACKRVYKAFDIIDGVEVAWNQVEMIGLDLEREARDRLFGEIHTLQALKHRNIMSFHDWWFNAQVQTINFITELFTSGTLRQYRKRMRTHISEAVIKRWAWQILQGLVYLHAHDPPIVHRDLKCDNIFINGSTGQVKIGDLGLATAQQGLSVVGTPEFMAPEIYEEQYDEKVDVYSFGMCLLELATLEYPYSECHGVAQIYRKVTTGVKPQALDRVGSSQLREMIELCIAHDPDDRPTARQLVKHSFFEVVRMENSIGGHMAHAPSGMLSSSSSQSLHHSSTAPSLTEAAIQQATRRHFTIRVQQPRQLNSTASTVYGATAATLKRSTSMTEQIRGSLATPVTLNYPQPHLHLQAEDEQQGLRPFSRQQALPSELSPAMEQSMPGVEEGLGSGLNSAPHSAGSTLSSAAAQALLQERNKRARPDPGPSPLALCSVCSHPITDLLLGETEDEHLSERLTSAAASITSAASMAAASAEARGPTPASVCSSVSNMLIACQQQPGQQSAPGPQGEVSVDSILQASCCICPQSSAAGVLAGRRSLLGPHPRSNASLTGSMGSPLRSSSVAGAIGGEGSGVPLVPSLPQHIHALRAAGRLGSLFGSATPASSSNSPRVSVEGSVPVTGEVVALPPRAAFRPHVADRLHFLAQRSRQAHDASLHGHGSINLASLTNTPINILSFPSPLHSNAGIATPGLATPGIATPGTAGVSCAGYSVRSASRRHTDGAGLGPAAVAAAAAALDRDCDDDSSEESFTDDDASSDASSVEVIVPLEAIQQEAAAQHQAEAVGLLPSMRAGMAFAFSGCTNTTGNSVNLSACSSARLGGVLPAGLPHLPSVPTLTRMPSLSAQLGVGGTPGMLRSLASSRCTSGRIMFQAHVRNGSVMGAADTPCLTAAPSFAQRSVHQTGLGQAAANSKSGSMDGTQVAQTPPLEHQQLPTSAQQQTSKQANTADDNDGFSVSECHTPYSTALRSQQELQIAIAEAHTFLQQEQQLAHAAAPPPTPEFALQRPLLHSLMRNYGSAPGHPAPMPDSREGLRRAVIGASTLRKTGLPATLMLPPGPGDDWDAGPPSSPVTATVFNVPAVAKGGDAGKMAQLLPTEGWQASQSAMSTTCLRPHGPEQQLHSQSAKEGQLSTAREATQHIWGSTVSDDLPLLAQHQVEQASTATRTARPLARAGLLHSAGSYTARAPDELSAEYGKPVAGVIVRVRRKRAQQLYRQAADIRVQVQEKDLEYFMQPSATLGLLARSYSL